MCIRDSYHNERYWFDEKEEAIMTEANQEFEQSPLIEQLFLVYYRVADDEEEGEWILAADILQRIQTVSYTHLDVYKRQVLNMKSKLIIISQITNESFS